MKLHRLIQLILMFVVGKNKTSLFFFFFFFKFRYLPINLIDHGQITKNLKEGAGAGNQLVKSAITFEPYKIT